MRTRSSASLFALSVLAMSACGGDDPPGSLIVPFEIGAALGNECTALNVADVTVELWSMPPEGAAGEKVDEENVPCSDTKATFTNVPPGRYELKVYGHDPESITVVDNAGKDMPDIAEVTSGAENTADPVNLSATPARVLVRWPINMGNKMCSGVPLNEIVVSIFKSSDASKLYEYAFPCDPMQSTEDGISQDDLDNGYKLVIDMERKVKGSELDLIKIEPRDAMGNKIDDTTLSFKMTPPGHGRTIRLSAPANCSGTTCDLTCTAPDPMDPMNCLPD